MGSGERQYVTLTGGAPWGFRLQGGGHTPLTVSKIRRKSQAHTSGIQEGDSLLTINGVTARGKSHEEAMELIDSGGIKLTLELIRGNPNEMDIAPPSFGCIVNGFVPPSHLASQLPSSASFQSFSPVVTTMNAPTESYREWEANTFVRQEQTTPMFAAPKPWNPSLYENQVAKPFSPTGFSPSPKVQVSAMYGSSEVKENIPPRRLSLQPYSERSPRYSPRSISPGDTGVDRMPALNVWTLKEMPKYTRPTPVPKPKKVVEAPPTFPVTPIRKPQPPPVAPKPKPPSPPPPPPEPDHPAHLYAPPIDSLEKSEHKLSNSGYFGSPFGYKPHNLALERTFSLESDLSSTSSAHGRFKKHYGDSAFYNDPEKNFPTIEDQMKLCKAIAVSLTSAANKKARGARMFAKRQKKSPKWVHDEVTVGKVSSTGGDDVANLLDLDSELYYVDGGTKPLFSFRVPNLKNRVNSPESTPKMSLSKDEFEKLRLKSQKNEHKNVSPNQCFDLVANLKSGKGRGAKLFEKRQKKAERWVIDGNNAKKTAPVIPMNRLDLMLMSPPKPYQSPWEAAAKGQDVNSAFDHLSEFEKQQRLNQILGYTPPKPQVTEPEIRPQPMHITPVSQTSLKADYQQSLLDGQQNFNRVAKGWGGFSGPSGGNNNTPVMIVAEPVVPVIQKPKQLVPQRDYNPKPRAWIGTPQGEEQDSSPEPMNSSPLPAVWTPSAHSPNDRNMFSPSSYSTYSSSGQPSPNYYGQNIGMYNNGYSSYPVELPGSDL